MAAIGVERDAALGYDGLRQGIAYDAGIRSVLLAYAVDDKSTLETVVERQTWKPLPDPADGRPVANATTGLPPGAVF